MAGEVTFEDAVLRRLAELTSLPGWTAEPTPLLFSSDGNTAVKITSGPAGKGRRRGTFLIVGPTTADCFRALAAVVEALAAGD